MYTTKVKSGNAEIISSGTVISFNGQPIEIEFGDESERLTFIFEFHEDKAKGDSPSMFANADGLVLRIILNNFNNSLGSGSNVPLQIGIFKGKLLFMNFRVYRLDNADRTLEYSIYLTEEVKKDDADAINLPR